MLCEIHPPRRSHGTRWRCFSDAEMDLFVWLDRQMPVRFHLSYNKQQNAHSLSWDREHGFRHSRADQAERAVRNGKMTPLPPTTTHDDGFDALQLASRFLRASDHIDPTLADFIYARLLEYPQPHRRRANLHIGATKD